MKLQRGCVEAVVTAVLRDEKIEASLIEVEFLGDRRMRHLHKKFFKDPSSTDCMTFPVDTSHRSSLVGSVAICPKTALAFAGINRFWEELTLYLVHGLLHLAGYTDETPPSRVRMHRRQNVVLSRLKKRSLLLAGSLS